MEIKINIEKKHLFVLIFVFVALAGVIVVIAQPPATQNPGHDIGEISGDIPINQVPGAARNCAFVNSPFCQPASALSWRLSDVAIASGFSARSVNSDNSDKLDNIDSTGFCQTDGAGCPPIPTIPSTTVYKLSVTSSCGGTALFCKGAISYGADPLGIRLSWRNQQGASVPYTSPGLWWYLSASNIQTKCQDWVLCTQSS